MEKYLKINPQEAFLPTKMTLADTKTLLTEINKTYGNFVTPKDIKEVRKKFKKVGKQKFFGVDSWETLEDDRNREINQEFEIMMEATKNKLDQLDEKKIPDILEEEIVQTALLEMNAEKILKQNKQKEEKKKEQWDESMEELLNQETVINS